MYKFICLNHLRHFILDKITYTEEASDDDRKEEEDLRRKRSFVYGGGGQHYVTNSEVKDAMEAFDVRISNLLHNLIYSFKSSRSIY